MKRTVRENLRKYKTNQYQPKPVQSQSPPHKKLLQKIENVYRPEAIKYEHSLPDAYVRPEKKEEAQDFRIEIEKRFQKSHSNKHFVLPLHNENDLESDAESSLDSLKHVTVYDLASQNQRKKAPVNNILKSNVLGRDISIGSRLQTEIADNASDIDQIDESFSDVPIEIRIRDKQSSTYKNLIRLLEAQPMFSHNSTNTDTKQQANNYGQIQDTDFEREDYTNAREVGKGQARLTNNYFKQEPYSNFTTQASTSDTQKGFRNGNFQKEKSSGNERDPKYSERTGNSKERGNRMESSASNERTSVTKGSKTTFIDTGRTAQESLKQLYIQNINASKSITPQYATINMNDMFSRDGVFKTYNGDNMRVQTSSGRTRNGASSGRSPLENLYQRAQKDIVQNKFRLVGRVPGANPSTGKSHSSKHSKDANQSSSTLTTSGTPFKRDETPKDPVKKLAFASFYGASSQAMERLSTINPSGIENIIPKQNSAKGLQIVSPLKKSNDKIFSTFYDNTQPKFFQKAGFKLDLSKRNQGTRERDALSSSRIRNKTPDKGYNEGFQTVVMRTSYDMKNNLNGSAYGAGVQKNPPRVSDAPNQRGSFKDNSFSRNNQSVKINLNQ